MKKIISCIAITVLLFACSKTDITTTNDQSIDETGLNLKSSKIDVCHNGHIINVSWSAVPAHLAHGDAVADEDGNIECAPVAPSNCTYPADCGFCEYLDLFDFNEPCDEYFAWGDYYYSGSWTYPNGSVSGEAHIVDSDFNNDAGNNSCYVDDGENDWGEIWVSWWKTLDDDGNVVEYYGQFQCSLVIDPPNDNPHPYGGAPGEYNTVFTPVTYFAFTQDAYEAAILWGALIDCLAAENGLTNQWE